MSWRAFRIYNLFNQWWLRLQRRRSLPVRTWIVLWKSSNTSLRLLTPTTSLTKRVSKTMPQSCKSIQQRPRQIPKTYRSIKIKQAHTCKHTSAAFCFYLKSWARSVVTLLMHSLINSIESSIKLCAALVWWVRSDRLASLILQRPSCKRISSKCSCRQRFLTKSSESILMSGEQLRTPQTSWSNRRIRNSWVAYSTICLLECSEL